MEFTTRVLGARAAERLRQRQVTQTIRAKLYPLGTYAVRLDGEPLGLVTIIGAIRHGMETLTEEDAKRGGFDTREELLKALRRAGYRFKEPERHIAWVIRFEWIE